MAAHRPTSAVADEAGVAAVDELSSALADFTELLRFFRNKILPDGTLDDRASPELARIRREIERQRRHIQESLRAYLRRLAEGGAVQDELITIRGERFVIPVKIEQKRRVQGVVHGASSSGQTVFVEPLETIEQNNELVRLLEEEQAEIHRILLEMTARIGQQQPPSWPRPPCWPSWSCNSPRRDSQRITSARDRQGADPWLLLPRVRTLILFLERSHPWRTGQGWGTHWNRPPQRPPPCCWSAR